jgi:excisionase family DNA binding protein
MLRYKHIATPEEKVDLQSVSCIVKETRMNSKQLLTVLEVAECLSLSRAFTYQLINSGQLESIRIGRARRVPAEAVAEFVARLRQQQGEKLLSSNAYKRDRMDTAMPKKGRPGAIQQDNSRKKNA